MVLERAARDIAMGRVQAEMDAGDHIYAGGTRRWAVLAFNVQAAQLVSREQWPPQQEGRWWDDGRYELRLPNVDDTAMVMDLLRQGEQVQVLEPPKLVLAVRRLAPAAALYGGDPPAPG